MHDYTAKRGVEACFILSPADAPSWAQDRAALWNAAEARETRSNSVAARKWEPALPFEISDAALINIAPAFTQALVDRYEVAAVVTIYAPHREDDQRNHHAHIPIATRVLPADGLNDKTRILDTASTGGPEIEAMRGYWAELQNSALELVGQESPSRSPVPGSAARGGAIPGRYAEDPATGPRAGVEAWSRRLCHRAPRAAGGRGRGPRP